MEKTRFLEIKKIHLLEENVFKTDFYPESGIFEVTFVDSKTVYIMAVNTLIKTTSFLGIAHDFYSSINEQNPKPEPAPGFTFEPIAQQPEPIKPETAFTPDFILELSRILTREKDQRNRFTNP